jgi:tetratricopeptide (TPR) repeat protein
MKQLWNVLAAALLITACNNKSEHEQNGNSTIPVQEKEMKDAIAQYPDSLILKENLIQYYRDNGNFDMAIASTNAAIAKDSLNARLWDIKAILHFEDGDTMASIKAYEKAIEIFPDPEYIMTLGSQYAETRNPKALEVADALLIGKKAHAEKEALFIKGLYYSYINDSQKAIDFFNKCIELDYTFMFAYREKAIVLYNTGKYEEALDVLNRAITLQNNFDEGYYWMGRCLEKMNRTAEAIESYRTALRYDPDFIEAKDALSKLGVK